MAPPRRTSSTAGRKIHHHDQLEKGLACDCCRRRKVRCNGASPACSACLRTNNYEGKPELDCVCHYSGKMRGKRIRRRGVKVEEGLAKMLDATAEEKARTTSPSLPPPPRSEESQSPLQRADFYHDAEAFPFPAQDWTSYLSSSSSSSSDAFSSSYDYSPPSSFYTPIHTPPSTSQLLYLSLSSAAPPVPVTESLPRIFDEQFLDFNLFPSFPTVDFSPPLALFPPQPPSNFFHPTSVLTAALGTPEPPLNDFLPLSQWSDPDSLAMYLAAINEERLSLVRGVWGDEMALLFQGLGEEEQWGLEQGARGEWVR